MPNRNITKPPADLAAWRKEQRSRLIAERLALPEALRQQHDAAIFKHLQTLVAQLRPAVLGFCWPYRGEFDCRPLLSDWQAQGIQLALPLVTDTAAPLEFRCWRTDSPLVEGRYGIPVPAEGEWVQPDVLLLPLNGFDAAGYRLGYGGGYFDRTLAAMTPPPVAVGVGYELGRLVSIFPAEHDLPLNWLVTEVGVSGVRPG